MINNVVNSEWSMAVPEELLLIEDILEMRGGAVVGLKRNLLLQIFCTLLY